jgi:hypothetical protein
MANTPRSNKRTGAIPTGKPATGRGATAPISTTGEDPYVPAPIADTVVTPEPAVTPVDIDTNQGGADVFAALRASVPPLPDTYTLPAEPVAPTPVVAPPAPEPAVTEEQTIHTYLRDHHRVVSQDAYPHSVRIIIEQMEEYILAMGPRSPITADMGKVHQRKLYNSFLTALQAKNGEYMNAIAAILYYFHRERAGCFELRLAFRFMDVIKLDAANLSAFQQLLNLFTLTANPATRQQGLLSADIGKVITFLPSATAKEHLLAFYTHRR